MVERRVLGAWLDWVYQQEQVLEGFTSPEQADLIAKFKELDEQLVLAAQFQVRRKIFERYPDIYATSGRTNELGMLRGELSKRRMRAPVRKLFRTIPRLIQTLKPCFLVSPLAVSQYLPFSELSSETLNFDVVIFDEASQVFPEDAIPAVLRGKQLVLAGDQKQLPPSSFFKRSPAEDEAGYDDDGADDQSNQLVGRESILDVAVGLVGRLFNEAHLNVHYRSRDESLIGFSNHHFYGDQLLTFPSPGLRDSWYGVHDVYVPDGRYDAGATRTNRKEAEQIVELVFQHMRTRPAGESLGVVALSRAQADLIDRLIEERRILERDVDERFAERPDEPFFVKNLENVQGDERDHIIICVGYGPTVGSGAVPPNRFGPLNIDGGERRLNVVVTRARQRMAVVHSLRATDIHSQQEGARLLRRFLEYAANAQQAFEAEATVDAAAEPESPFEAAVEQALLAKGYRVARQVGVSGYRIDLAILSEDGTKCDLGIECDGWTYHSTPAARDRDWLRQQVLEGLGWNIHRVWSTAWIRNPEAELARIDLALVEGRAGAKITPDSLSQIQSRDGDFLSPLDGVGNRVEPVDPPEVTIAPSTTPEIVLMDYIAARLPKPDHWAELRYETTETLVPLIVQIAEVEGPVHREIIVERLRLHYGMGRVTGSTREHVEHAIMVAQLGGQVQGDDTFIWVRNEQLGRAPRRPVDGNVEHIPPFELGAIVYATAKFLFGTPRRQLVIEAARRLGFNRTGPRLNEALDRTVQDLLAEERLAESFGMIYAVG
jgi:very-short-patch-repair endonuclease